MANDKIGSYIGFAIKARNVLFGQYTIENYKKHVYLLIVCESAKKNTIKSALNLKEKFNAPLITTKGILLDDVVYKQNCKIIAITNKNLADAILKNLNENYLIFKEENLIEQEQ